MNPISGFVESNGRDRWLYAAMANVEPEVSTGHGNTGPCMHTEEETLSRITFREGSVVEMLF